MVKVPARTTISLLAADKKLTLDVDVTGSFEEELDADELEVEVDGSMSSTTAAAGFLEARASLGC